MVDKKRGKNPNYTRQVRKPDDKPLCVNFLSGAGSGKSTNAVLLHGILKVHGITSEYTGEEAKDLAFEGRLELPIDDIRLFALQRHRQWRLKDQVDIIVSDSPLILSSIYRSDDSLLDALVLQEFNKYENINFFIERKKRYIKIGRKETKAEATKIDDKTRRFLDNNHIPYTVIEGTVDGVNKVIDIVLQKLNTKKLYKIGKL